MDLTELFELINKIQDVMPSVIFKIVDEFNGEGSVGNQRHLIYVMMGLSKDFEKALLTECSIGDQETLDLLREFICKHDCKTLFDDVDLFMETSSIAVKADNLDALNFILKTTKNSYLHIFSSQVFDQALDNDSANVAQMIYHGHLGKVGSLNMRLYNMCRKKLVRSAKLLLELGANPNVYKGKGFTYALKTKNMDLIRTFIERKVDLNTNESPLITAIQLRDDDLIRYLVEEGAGFDDKVLKTAIGYNMTEIFHYLMGLRKKQDYTNPGYLINCAKTGNVELMDFLVMKGANLTICDLVEPTLFYGHLSVLQYLDSRKVLEVNSNHLCLAVIYDKPEIVRLIISKGVCLTPIQKEDVIKVGYDGYISNETLNQVDLRCLYTDMQEYTITYI